jgi:hypothetical protein
MPANVCGVGQRLMIARHKRRLSQFSDFCDRNDLPLFSCGRSTGSYLET